MRQTVKNLKKAAAEQRDQSAKMEESYKNKLSEKQQQITRMGLKLAGRVNRLLRPPPSVLALARARLSVCRARLRMLLPKPRFSCARQKCARRACLTPRFGIGSTVLRKQT